MPALIGRDRPVELIQDMIGRTVDSHGGLVLVEGEPGIGKTALVTHALAAARERGTVVVSAACWSGESTPGYWPWIQVVRNLQRELGPEDWAAAANAAGPGLTFMLGEISEPPPVAEFGDAAFELCDAITSLLVTVSRSRPLVVALDDLHWADAPSVRALDFVVHHSWFEKILIVGTYRSAEVDAPGHPLRRLLPPLAGKAATVTLTGLDSADVAVLIAQTTGSRPGEQVAEETHRRTGGNPLFVEELARLWQAGGPLDALPPGVRDAVDRRLDRLPARLRDLLAHAAVVGPVFHRRVVAAAAGMPAAEVDQLLRQAALARLVVTAEAGWFSFAHDLVREQLYDSLAPEERRTRHARTLRALEGAGRDDITTAQLAHHAYHAVPEISAVAATRHLLAAAREAACRLATEEARTHHLRTLELIPPGDQRRRAQIELALGEQQQKAGDVDSARESFDEALSSALDLGDSELAARARAALAVLPDRAPAGGDAAPAGGPARFRFDGSVWELEFAGRTAHLPDAKGLHDLHVLLKNPGVDVPAADLLAEGGDDNVRAARRLGGDAVLDDTAKAQYRRRLADLDEEIERALARHDDYHAATLDEERAALLEELRSAAGLAGRSRRLGDEAERSRKTVSARIRDTLRRLDDRHPELAEHLRDSVSTGLACRYQPDRPVSWTLS